MTSAPTGGRLRGMANFIRLTRAGSNKEVIYINADQIIKVVPHTGGGSYITLTEIKGDKNCHESVVESPSVIYDLQ